MQTTLQNSSHKIDLIFQIVLHFSSIQIIDYFVFIFEEAVDAFIGHSSDMESM